MADMRKALESEREQEKQFVAEAIRSETQPKGWPAALVMFHISMWRERLRDALTEFRHARPYAAPPENIDEVNDAELASGIGAPLADAAARGQAARRADRARGRAGRSSFQMVQRNDHR
jgi:hypothetical protein